MNSRFTLACFASLLVVSLGACSGMSRRDENTATGAVIGGVAGSVLSGGSTAGAVGGAVVGGVIGDQVRQEVVSPVFRAR